MKTALFILLLSTLPLTVNAQRPKSLTKVDLDVNGLHFGMNTNEVYDLFWGSRTGEGTQEHGFSWDYDGAIVCFSSKRTVICIDVIDPRYPTRRGLRVGDTPAKVLKLYGRPTRTVDDSYWTYVYPGDSTKGISFFFEDHSSKKRDTVTFFRVGQLRLE